MKTFIEKVTFKNTHTISLQKLKHVVIFIHAIQPKIQTYS